MDKVSYMNGEKIESKYFQIHYRPSEDFSNFDLNFGCTRLLTYLALADIKRDKESVEMLQAKYTELLSKCKNDKEKANLDKFIQSVSKIGGYASSFFSGLNQAKSVTSVDVKKEEKIEEKKKEEIKVERKVVNKRAPVSNAYSNGIQSKYFDVKYRPSEDKSNFDLNLACSSLLTYMAIADASRSRESGNSLVNHFLLTITKCNSEEEIENLRKFIDEVASIGGIAIEFSEQFRGMINLKNKDIILNSLNEFDKKKKASYEEDIRKKKKAADDKYLEEEKKKKMASFQEWEHRYKRLKSSYEQFRSNSMKHLDDLDIIISKSKILQEDLYYFADVIDRKVYINLDLDLDEFISKLRRDREMLEEISRVYF